MVMKLARTLRFKLIFAFVAVIVPMAVALLLLNLYAKQVVREEVSQSTVNLLSLHATQIDGSLQKVSEYLLRLGADKVYYSDLVGLTLYPRDSSDYFFAMQRIFNSFQDEINTNSYVPVDTFFAYTARYDELVATQISYASSQRTNDMLIELMKEPEITGNENWQIVDRKDQRYLLRIEQIQSNVYVGALIPAESLMFPLAKLNLGETGKALLISNDARPLGATTLPDITLQEINERLAGGTEPYQIMTDPADGTRYLLVGFAAEHAPMKLVVMIPDTEMLQRLPDFQRGLILIPIGLVVLLIIVSYVLKQVLFQPMSNLIRGMRRMAQGDFAVRLEDGGTEEFRFVNRTFNQMVTEIRQLKIDVYEEILKTQNAEFKRLQAQINPHFYLNSLNIIYSLSKLKRNELVEQMAEHLAEYFRFITRSNREFITLQEEIGHIRNYLEIQKLRFPDKLTFELLIPDPYLQVSIAPLIVQPFVENAVIHGMKKGKTKFHLQVEARAYAAASPMLEIVIVDNGSGFPPQTLDLLQNGQQAVSGLNTRSLGIRNVLDRLQLKYGEDFHAQFSNRMDEKEPGVVRGALVILRIPLETNEEEKGDHHV